MRRYFLFVAAFTGWLILGPTPAYVAHAADLQGATKSRLTTPLTNPTKSTRTISAKPLERHFGTTAICVCGADTGTCEPAGCDSEGQDPNVCVCGGDGEGGWSCTPAGCDGSSAAQGLAQDLFRSKELSRDFAKRFLTPRNFSTVEREMRITPIDLPRDTLQKTVVSPIQ